MLMARIEGATRELGKPKDWPADKPCMTLPIRDVELEGGQHAMGSAWMPDPDELARLKNGGHVILWIFGEGHPPVHLQVGSAPDVESFKGIMHYEADCGALISDREIPGVTRSSSQGFFVGESMSISAARTIANALGFAFTEPT